MLSWKIVPPIRNVNFPYFLSDSQISFIIFKTVHSASRSPMSCSEEPSLMVSPGRSWKFCQVLQLFSSPGDTGGSLRQGRDTKGVGVILQTFKKDFKLKDCFILILRLRRSDKTLCFVSHRPPSGQIPGECWPRWTLGNVRPGPSYRHCRPQDTEDRSLLWSRDFHQGLRGSAETHGTEGREVSHRRCWMSLCWKVSQNKNLTLSTLQCTEQLSGPHSR